MSAFAAASTFVLVLNWWVESEAALTAQEVDVYFGNAGRIALAKISTFHRAF